MTTTKYGTPGTFTTVLTGSTDLGAGGVTTGTASALGATVIDGRTNLDLYADFVLSVTFGSAPTLNQTVDLYLVPAVDNTNYGDTVAITSTTAPKGTYYKGSFVLSAATTQRVPLQTGVLLSPNKMKVQIYNQAGVTLPNTATVSYSIYELQTA